MADKDFVLVQENVNRFFLVSSAALAVHVGIVDLQDKRNAQKTKKDDEALVEDVVAAVTICVNGKD